MLMAFLSLHPEAQMKVTEGKTLCRKQEVPFSLLADLLGQEAHHLPKNPTHFYKAENTQSIRKLGLLTERVLCTQSTHGSLCAAIETPRFRFCPPCWGPSCRRAGGV